MNDTAVRALSDLRPGPITEAQVRKFEGYIKENYEGVVFDLMVARDFVPGAAVELIWLIVEDRQRGTGTAIMREFCQFADRHAIAIRLKPASKADFAATTSRARLVRFYKRFGFVRDKSRADAPVLTRKPVV